MKLEAFVKPERFQPNRVILVRHVLSHLLFLSNEANAHRDRRTVLADLYRPVAIDFLAAHGVTEHSEVDRLASNIVR